MTVRSLWTKFRTEALLVLAGLVILFASLLAQHEILNTPDPGWFVEQPQPTSRIGFVGVPLDDVYIHCRYAENVLAGNGWSFNPGEAVSADTSPLWVLLLVVAGLFTQHLEIAAVILSALYYLIIAPGVYRIARDLLKLDEVWSITAAVLALLSSRLIWSGMSGMEASLAALLALLMAEEHARQVRRGHFRIREGVLYALGFLARPELALLAVLCLAHWLYVHSKHTVDFTRFGYSMLLAIVIVIPYIGFNLMTQGSLLPHSVDVQGARLTLLPDLGYLWFAGKILAMHNLLMLVGVVVAFVSLKRHEWLPGLLFVALLIPLQSVFAPQYRHHGRYFFPLLPLVILYGTWGVKSLLGNWQKFAYVVLPIAIVLSALDAVRWITLEAYAVRNINDQQVVAAEWVSKNVTPQDKLAVHDVGAIAYFSDKPVIDLVGLMTPSLYPMQGDQSKVWQEVRKMGANVFVIYNRLNPTFYTTYKDSLDLLAEFRIRKPIVSSADTVMSAYRLKQ